MKKNREVICAFAAWVLSACFFMSCFMIPGLAEKINSLGNSNMLVYGMSLILFCLLFASGMGIAHRHEVAGKTFPENVKARKTVFWLMLFIQIPFWLLCISGETEQLGSVAAKYGWHTQPAVIAAFLFLAELAIFFWACQNVCFPEKDGEWIIRLVYAALVLLVFYSMYTPNIFGRGELSDAYHGHAYFNSVYNIYQGMPYTHNVTSIYGHYGLFFKIPMELVHGDFKAFVAMVAGIGTYLCISYPGTAGQKPCVEGTWCFGSYISCTWYARWLLLAGLAASGNFSDAAVSVWSMDPQKRAVQFLDSSGWVSDLSAGNPLEYRDRTDSYCGVGRNAYFTFPVCGKNKDP